MADNPDKFRNNDKLRALMATRGWKAPHIVKLLGGTYVQNTVNKWHGKFLAMSDRAWTLLELKIRESGDYVSLDDLNQLPAMSNKPGPPYTGEV